MVAAEDLRPNDGQWRTYEARGNCVVLAGPGSGKTKTLTIKMARMLVEDVEAPRGIACITYNNQCARELKRRLLTLGVEDGKRTSIGTLHSFCLQHIVLPFSRLAGVPLPQPLRVATKGDRDQCWAGAVERIKGRFEPPRNWIFPCEVHRRTSLDRNDGAWMDSEDESAIVEAYELELAERGLVDFDGMVLTALQLVEGCEWVQRALHARFPILVVDEYQDLGHALHRIVLSLCFQAGLRLIAVGDPDQSIYGFTGADPSLLAELAEREDVSSVRLKLNYRCGPTIIAASEAALGDARGFESSRSEPGTVDVYHRPGGAEDQAEFICQTIIPDALGRRPGRCMGDIAVLYRDRYDGGVVAAAVEGKGWEFVRMDQGNPYPRSPVTFWLEDCAAWCAGGWASGEPRLSELAWTWRLLNDGVASEPAQRALKRDLVRFLYDRRDPDSPLRDWLREFYGACLRRTLEREPRLADDKAAVARLEEVAREGRELGGFTVSSFGGQGGCDTHLNLMTLHAAKGLEFDVVIMPCLEEGKLPSFRSGNSEAKLREDRRLFYVGLTRARHEVHLVYSGWYTNQYKRVFRNGPSRFLEELRAALGQPPP